MIFLGRNLIWIEPVFNKSVRCDYINTKQCNMIGKENIYLFLSSSNSYCIELRKRKIGRIYEIYPNGAKKQIKTRDFLNANYRDEKDMDSIINAIKIINILD